MSYSLFAGTVEVGADLFFKEGYDKKIYGKKVGLITNQTGIGSDFVSTIEKFISHAEEYTLAALFAPEHGLEGQVGAGEKFSDKKKQTIPVFSLYGKTRRPTKEMLDKVDVLVFDIQDIGTRSYTFLSTLCYVMEEAAKAKIPVIVLDRPNPINGKVVSGPMVDSNFRSFISYVNVPYCHGMTIGELSKFFNEEYAVGCSLTVVPMKGWKRSMTYADTGLIWMPPSPHIPEMDTPYYYPCTGILGELKIVSIGVGHTLPFKIVGAPWVKAEAFAAQLNEQKLKGVYFLPFHFRPNYGAYQKEDCHGVKIAITNPKIYDPYVVFSLITGLLKTLYPDEFIKRLRSHTDPKDMFNLAVGSDAVYEILKKEKYPYWKLAQLQKQQVAEFMTKRAKYLLPAYED